MKKFSWYTIVHPDWQEGQSPLFRLVGPAILPDEHTCDIFYKPNMKGGHTHNHIYNKCHKHIFRSKQARKNVDRKDKPEFVRIFHMNLELGNYSFDKLFAHDFSPQQKGK